MKSTGVESFTEASSTLVLFVVERWREHTERTRQMCYDMRDTTPRTLRIRPLHKSTLLLQDTCRRGLQYRWQKVDQESSM